MTAITVADLTQATLEGSGIFDTLMRANKAHLEAEFTKGRIRGPEYATVYLGSLEAVMQAALAFLMQNQKIDLEVQLLEQQILLAQKEVLKTTATIAQIEAQTLLAEQQKANLVAEALNIPKQGLVLDAQKLQIEQQTLNLVSEKALTDAKVSLTTQQTANAVIEGTVLTAQKCKLDAEYDVLMLQKAKVTAETGLLNQKVLTEKAQTLALGVDDNSVIGRQKALYVAQTNGFARDAEQKATDILVKTWSVRRTTDEATVADGVNMLNDATIGRAVDKLLTGVGA